MAAFTKEQLSDIIGKVTEQVGKEIAVGEAARFEVADLRAQFADLVKGGNAAWTISYSTSSAAINQLERLGQVAWTISYSTSSAAIMDRQTAK